MRILCFLKSGRAWLLAVWCAVAVARGSYCAEDRAPAESELINGLIQDLGDKNYKVRDAAARRLIDMEEAEAALRKALDSKDFETARLAARILDEQRKQETARVLRIIRQELKCGEIDRAVDRLVSWNGPESDAASWQLVMDFCWETHARAIKLRPVIFKTGRDVIVPPKSTKDLEQGAAYSSSPREPASVKYHYGCIRANGVSARQGVVGVVVSSNGMEMPGGQSGSLFVVNGSIGRAITLSNCIIICDGDVRVSGAIFNSIVIARGTVYCPNAVNDSVIISSGRVLDAEAKKTNLPGGFTSRDNEVTPLNFVKWFTPMDVGLEVVSDKGDIRVDKLHDGRLPAKAGLKVGDVINAVDGSKVDSAESFRRLLRKGSVQTKCVLTVERGGKSLEVLLDFRAEERAQEKAKEAQKK